MHPPIAASTVEVVDRSHPITAGLEDFEVCDEKYSYLDIAPDARPLASHQFEGGTHPILWVLEAAPGGLSTMRWDTTAGHIARLRDESSSDGRLIGLSVDQSRETSTLHAVTEPLADLDLGRGPGLGSIRGAPSRTY